MVEHYAVEVEVAVVQKAEESKEMTTALLMVQPLFRNQRVLVVLMLP